VAAAAWVGALLPLALLIGPAVAGADPSSTAVAREVVLRFSVLGIASVGTLAATGIINTWAIVGNLTTLITTDYGRLLLFKIALFLVMLSLAGVNRLWLTPVLQHKGDPVAGPKALRRIRINAVLEAAIGFAVVGIVGLLGTMSPNF
jgi:putative copper resistance protein D